MNTDIKQTKSKISWSWMAFIFTPLWLGYNKMHTLCTINLLSYIAEIALGYILTQNEINFQMTGVLPAISSIIFGLYGKHFKETLKQKLDQAGKTLKQSWISLIVSLLFSVIVIGITMALTMYNTVVFSFGFEISLISVLYASVNYLAILLFQGIIAVIVLGMIIIWIGMYIFALCIQNFFSNQLYYSSAINGEDKYYLNIPSKIDEKLSSLITDNNSYIRLVNITQENFIQSKLCNEKEGTKYYLIGYRINEENQNHLSDICYNKAVTISLFNKFYNGDDSYKTDIKWKLLESKE